MSKPEQQTVSDVESVQTIPLDADGEVQLPIVELLTGRGFITGKSGSGKSNSASVVVEELLDRGYPVCIVDTDGEYWGLKQDYEILHVGADEECDLQVGSEHGEKLAELALDQGVPLILDVSGYLNAEEADAVVAETARHLFAKEKKLKRPFLLLVEEIHEYLPQQGTGGEAGDQLVRIAKRGRKRGLGLTGMSQRPADVDKSFITQCDWLLWHRLTWENDTAVVRSVVGSDYADPVQHLDDGEGFLMADFLEPDVTTVQVRRKRTFDAGATPDLGEYERPDLKSVDTDLVDELEEISEREERRQDRIAELERELHAVREERDELEEELQSARDMRDLAQQMAEGLQATGDTEGVAQERVDDLVEERNELRREVEDREETIATLRERVTELEQELEQRPDLSDRAHEAVAVLSEEFGIGDADDKRLREKLQNARERIEELEAGESEKSIPEPEFDPLETRDAGRVLDDLDDHLSDWNDTRMTMLRYYVLRGPASVTDAYKATGNSPSSGWKDTVNRDLQNSGLVVETKSGYDYDPEHFVRERMSEEYTDEEIAVVVEAVEDRVDEAIREEATA